MSHSSQSLRISVTAVLNSNDQVLLLLERVRCFVLNPGAD